MQSSWFSFTQVREGGEIQLKGAFLVLDIFDQLVAVFLTPSRISRRLFNVACLLAYVSQQKPVPACGKKDVNESMADKKRVEQFWH